MFQTEKDTRNQSSKLLREF